MAVLQATTVSPGLRWRTLEWWGAGIGLFLQTGAVFPLLLGDGNGGIDDAARAKLRLLALPVYFISLALLHRHPGQLVAAVRRNLPLLLFLALPVASVLWSISPSVSLRRVIGLLGSALFAYLLAIRFTPRQLMVLVAVVLGACMALSVLMLAAVPHMAISDGGDVRGAFANKNVLGWAAVLAGVSGGLMAVDRAVGHRWVGAAILMLSAINLLASHSVTGLFAAVMALVLVWFYRRLTRARGLSRLVFVLLFLQIASAVLIALDEFLVPLLEALGKDATLTGRVPLWHLVDRAIAVRPMLGYGYQAFWSDASPGAWRIWAEIQWMAPHSHNGFRETLLGLGLVGLALFTVVIVRALRQGAALQCRAPEEGWLWLNVWVGTFLVMNLTESMILAQNDIFWALVMTAVIAFGLRYPEDRYQSRRF